ncbi:MAG: hypothetical protein B6I17_03635 [Tenericutes bacterium 4572_104]|nr:MAG: hypothetical protein B6I17_03635 [Tenericutes bacterium 4572_104]
MRGKVMNLYLGIDGGGTKTKVSIIDESENLIFENTSGPSSIDTVSNEETYKAFKEAIDPFIAKNRNTKIKGVFAGLGGIVFEKDYELVSNIIRLLPGIDKNTFVMARNDMENALYSSNHFDSGMALICGTGMVAFGKNNGLTHKCGGWGFREGELGSAYHLGVEAIRHSIRAYDSRYKMDDFAKDVANSLNLKVASDIIKIMNEIQGNRTFIASLAPIVTKHANKGNIYAKQIIDLATDELILAIQGVYNKLNFKKTTLVIIGSLGNSKGYFSDSLKTKLKETNPNIKLVKAVFDPSLAAAIAAKRFFKE